ncbi:MAG: hypothetical protein ACM3S0_00605 [Acidobacteriota bacterium]
MPTRNERLNGLNVFGTLLNGLNMFSPYAAALDFWAVLFGKISRLEYTLPVFQTQRGKP